MDFHTGSPIGEVEMLHLQLAARFKPVGRARPQCQAGQSRVEIHHAGGFQRGAIAVGLADPDGVLDFCKQGKEAGLHGERGLMGRLDTAAGNLSRPAIKSANS